MKKFALIAATASLAVVSTGASAGYVSTIPSLSGVVEASDFGPDSGGAFDGVFTLRLRDLSGSGTLVVPPNGTYGAEAKGSVAIDTSTTGAFVPEFAYTQATYAAVGTGSFTATGLTGAWVRTVQGLVFLAAVVFYLLVEEPQRRASLLRRLRLA